MDYKITYNNSTKKKLLLNSFLQKWGKKFEMVPHVIDYLSSYPEIVEGLEASFIIGKDELWGSQLEWISLVSKFNNPIEAGFYKEYWVPIQSNNYDYFIDLSSESLAIISPEYFFFEPYRWHKKIVVKDLQQFLLNTNNSYFSISEYFKITEDENLFQIEERFNERDELGFAGKIELDKLEIKKLYIPARHKETKIYRNELSFKFVYPQFIQLLDENLTITIYHFEAPFNRYGINEIRERVKTIKGFVYLLEAVGSYSDISYVLYFDNGKDNRVEFEDNTFSIYHSDIEIIKNLCDKTGKLSTYNSHT